MKPQKYYNTYQLKMPIDKGYFSIQGKSFTMGENDIFLIPPNVTIKYEPDRETPWEYIRFEFSGVNADALAKNALLTPDEPVYHNEDEFIPKLLEEMVNTSFWIADDLISQSYALRFFSEIMKQRCVDSSDKITGGQEFLHEVTRYIENNYSDYNLGLKSIANHFYLSQSYMSHYFKQLSGRGLNSFITDFRLRRSRELLAKRPDLTIEEVAHSVGFSDALYFSKVFRKNFFSTPSVYAKNFIANDQTIKD